MADGSSWSSYLLDRGRRNKYNHHHQFILISPPSLRLGLLRVLSRVALFTYLSAFTPPRAIQMKINQKKEPWITSQRRGVPESRLLLAQRARPEGREKWHGMGPIKIAKKGTNHLPLSFIYPFRLISCYSDATTRLVFLSKGESLPIYPNVNIIGWFTDTLHSL